MFRSRRLTLLVLTTFAVLMLAGAAAVLFRTQIAEALIIRELARRGLDAEVEIAELWWNSATAENISIDVLKLEHFKAEYSLGELRNGNLRSLEIAGLDITVDLTGEGPPLGALHQLFSNDRNSTTTQTVLPKVALSDAIITVHTPGRDIVVNATGTLIPEVGGNDLALEFEVTSVPFSGSGAVNGTISRTQITALSVSADFSDEETQTTFHLNAQSEDLDLKRLVVDFDLTGSGDVAPLAVYTSYDDGRWPQQGSFRLNVDGGITLPAAAPGLISTTAEANFSLAITDASTAWEVAPEWMRDPFNLNASGNGILTRGAFLGALTSELIFSNRGTRFDFSAPVARLAFEDDLTVVETSLIGFAAVAQGVPTPYGTVSRFEAIGDLADLHTSPTGQLRLRVFSPEIAFDAATVRTAALDANVNLIPTDDGYRVDLTAPADVSASIVNVSPLEPLNNFRGRITAARLGLTSTADGYSFVQTARITLPPLDPIVARQDAEPIRSEVTLGPGELTVRGAAGQPSHFTFAADVQSAALPDFELRAEDAALNVTGSVPGEIKATFSGGSATHTVEVPLFPPLSPEFELVRNGRRLSFLGRLSGADGMLLIDAEGSHDLEAETGEAIFTVNELQFGQGDATASDFLPLLSTMQNLRGRVAGGAHFSWNEEGLDQNSVVRLSEISFRRSGMDFVGVDANLNFDSLVPLRSLPGQHLTVQRIDTSLEPITNIDLEFAIDTNDDGAPLIRTGAIRMELAGGRLTSAGGTYDPITGAADIPLQAEELDLARLLARIGLEELTGEGRLNGTIPLRLSAGGASIESALLHAGSGGIVAYRSPNARQALASSGEAVGLMLDALEDFHYENLTLSLNKPIAGDTEITLRLEGNNPTVLEGHPFDINISLTGDADPLLRAFLAGQQLSNDLLRSITRQQRP